MGGVVAVVSLPPHDERMRQQTQVAAVIWHSIEQAASSEQVEGVCLRHEVELPVPCSSPPEEMEHLVELPGVQGDVDGSTSDREHVSGQVRQTVVGDLSGLPVSGPSEPGVLLVAGVAVLDDPEGVQ